MKILFSSDVSFHYFEGKYPGDDKAYAAMSEARTCFAQADFSVINLETTFGEADSYDPIPKSGPNQISSPEFLKYIEALSPSAAGLANNHTLDYGPEPLFNTIQSLNDMGIKTFGAGKSISDAYKPVCFELPEKKVAVIGVCENEFGIAEEDRPGSAGYSLGKITKEIQEALSKNYVPVVFFHGGNEHSPFPAPSKKELYRHFVDIGAGAVIAMHTHCPQGYEIYQGAPIVYSMGNFYFPAPSYPDRPRYKVWSYGYMSLLSFEGDGVTLDIIPYKQEFDGVHILCGEDKIYFEEYLRAISQPIQDDGLLQEYFDAWCIKQDYVSKIEKLLASADAGFAPFKNIMRCEAHNDVLRRQAVLRFEGVSDKAEKLAGDICDLQEMKIPHSLSK